MNLSTRRTSRRHRRLLLCVSLSFAVVYFSAIPVSVIARAQAIDVTNLHASQGLGATGVVSSGDEMAFDRPDFDDSKWLPVDEKKTMRGLFPTTIPAIVWQRIHVKVDPSQTGLGLEAFGISEAYEVYVNGQRLVESGQVEPFIRYTEGARIVVPIPDAQVKTGSLTIAIRARALPRWWRGTGASFPPAMLSIGDEEVLRDQAWMATLRHSATDWVLHCIGIAVCLVAFALFIAQRKRLEYMWLSLAGLMLLLELPFRLIEPFRSLPANLAFAVSTLGFLGGICIVLMIFEFVCQKVGTWSLIYLAISAIFPVLGGWAWQAGTVSYTFFQLSQVPYQIAVGVGVLIVLLVHWRRGNREAGILLIPMVLWSLGTYLFAALFLLQQIPSIHDQTQRATRRLSTFTIGGFEVGLGNLTVMLFFVTIGVIVVRRSIRSSRQQAAMEAELEATREIQQVILPEKIEDIPGFTIESIYQPAQQVGGDFFQVLPDGNGGLLVVVGDVAGKGLPAAMMVSVLVGSIRTAADDIHDPAVMLHKLNERLIGRTRGGFSTALAAHIDSEGSVTIANAGHLSPYLDGHEVELPGALPLGILSPSVYESTRFTLPPGSRLTFYSDGVIEAQNPNGELFGFDRAREISTQPAADIVRAAQQFGQEDDITVVIIARELPIAAVA